MLNNLVAWITHPACLQHEMGAYHPESPRRLQAISDHLLTAGLMPLFLQLEAPQASRAALEKVHATDAIDRILDARPGQRYLQIDPDTAMNAYTVEAALRAAGAAVLAVDTVLAGDAGLAFCAVRPPGHHAERSTPMGFCFFNNIAVAAAHALDAGLSRVAIVDFDVHYGNGTADIFRDDPRVLLCSTYQEALFPGWCNDHGIAHLLDVPLRSGAGSAEYRDAIEQRWLPALCAHRPELILVSAGFDAHADDPLASLQLQTEDYRWTAEVLRDFAAEYCQCRVVATLEGGYELTALTHSVEAFLRPFARV